MFHFRHLAHPRDESFCLCSVSTFEHTLFTQNISIIRNFVIFFLFPGARYFCGRRKHSWPGRPVTRSTRTLGKVRFMPCGRRYIAWKLDTPSWCANKRKWCKIWRRACSSGRVSLSGINWCFCWPVQPKLSKPIGDADIFLDRLRWTYLTSLLYLFIVFMVPCTRG